MSFLSVPPCNETPDTQTWYLLVELNGISTILAYLSLISFTEPQQTSIHFRRADSDASPATARCEEMSPLVTLKALHPVALQHYTTETQEKAWTIFPSVRRRGEVGEEEHHSGVWPPITVLILKFQTLPGHLPSLPDPNWCKVSLTLGRGMTHSSDPLQPFFFFFLNLPWACWEVSKTVLFPTTYF